MPDMYHRDWQHTLASNGVAGAEIAATLGVMQANAALKARNIMLDTLEKSFSISRWISWRSCRNHTRGMCSANIELANVDEYRESRLIPRIERQSEVRPRPFEEECDITQW